GGFDLTADAAARPDRDAAAQVRTEELRVRADRARAFNPGERLNPDIGTEDDRAIGGVEDRVRVDSRAVMDAELVDRAHQGQSSQVPVAHPHVVDGVEVALQMLAV